MEWYYMAAIMFGSLIILLAIGIPVGFALMLVSLGSLYLLGGGFLYFLDLPGYIFHNLNSFILLCVPLFIAMAMFAHQARFSDDLFRSLNTILGRLPGGVINVAIVACAIFSAISGTSVATAAAVGLIAIPQFKKYGYDEKLSVGSLAAGGALGILIPPSVPMIMYCIITQQSIGKMFAAGLFPGILTAAIFIVYIIIRCRINPKLAPVTAIATGLPTREKFMILTGVIPLILIIVIVLSFIYFGICTVTESAAIGCLAALVLSFAYRRMNFAEMFKGAAEAMRIGAFIILIFIGAIIFGHVINRGGISTGLSDLVIELGLSKWAVLIVIQLILLILGMFMDPTPIILTTMPAFFPIAMQAGFDPTHFGILCVMNLEMACITPPVGFNLFILRGIGKDYVSMSDIIEGAAPFIGLYALTIVIVALFPQIAMFLPSLMVR